MPGDAECRWANVGNVLTTCTRAGRVTLVTDLPAEATVLWTDPATGEPWAVTVSWHEQGGVPTPVGLRLSSWRDARRDATAPLPAYREGVELPRMDGAVLRRLPVARLVQASRRNVAEALAQLAADYREFGRPYREIPEDVRETLPWELALMDLDRRLQARDFAERAERFEGRPRGGRDLGDEHYADVARIYRQAVVDGRPPTKAVEDHFQVAKSSAAKKVARARERGFLPANPGKGRIGRLTDGGQQ